MVEFDKYELKIKENEKPDVYIQCELIIPKNLDDGIWLLGNNDNTIIDLNHCTTTHDVNLVQYVDPSKNILCMDVTLLKKKDDNNQTKSEIAKKKYFYCLIPNTDGVTSRNDIITDNNDLFFGLVPTPVKLDGSQRVSRRKTALNEEMMSKNLLESILTERMRESANDPPVDTKSKNEAVTPESKKTTQQPESMYSPNGIPINEYYKLPLAVHMYDLASHSIDGLGNIAELRSPVQKVEIFESNVSTSLKDQLKGKEDLINNFNFARAVNDTVDRAHDFEYDYTGVTIATGVIDRNNVPELFSRTDKPKINVDKSHVIQDKNIEELETMLRAQDGVTVPAIPKPVFLNRMQVFAKYVAELIDGNMRIHYPESGKMVSYDTLVSYLNELQSEGPKESIEIRQFVKLVAMYVKKTDDIPTEVPKEKATDEKTRETIVHLKNSKTVKKNCFQQIDGCSAGDNEYNKPLLNVITNVFGCFDVHLESNICKEGNLQNTIVIKDSGAPEGPSLLTMERFPGQITYDSVAATINNEVPNNNKEGYFPSRGRGADLLKVTFSKKLGKATKVLLLMCLKTFCDKLYRFSTYGDDHITHIYTIDSYVYGDPILQYLTGECDYCPTVMRSGQGYSDQEGMVCNNDTNEKIKGFWVHEGIGSDMTARDPANDLYKKTMGYASFLSKFIAEYAVENRPPSEQFKNCHLKSDYLNVNDFPDSFPNNLPSSWRLINFLTRFQLNYQTYLNGRETKDNNTSKYEKSMAKLLEIELSNICNKLLAYLKKLKNLVISRIGSGGNLSSEQQNDLRKQLIELPDLENLLTMSVPNLFIENENTLFFEINKPLTLNKCEGIGIKGTGTTIENSSQTGGMDSGEIEMSSLKEVGSEQPKKFITGILFKGDGNITININKNLDDSVIDSSLLGSEYKNIGGSITGPETFGLLCYLLDNRDFFEENNLPATRSKKNYYEEVKNRVEQINDQYLNLVGGEPISGEQIAMDLVPQQRQGEEGEGEEEGERAVVEQPKFGSETTDDQFEKGVNAGRDRTGEEVGAPAPAPASPHKSGTTQDPGPINRVSFNENKRRRVQQNQKN